MPGWGRARGGKPAYRRSLAIKGESDQPPACNALAATGLQPRLVYASSAKEGGTTARPTENVPSPAGRSLPPPLSQRPTAPRGGRAGEPRVAPTPAVAPPAAARAVVGPPVASKGLSFCRRPGFGTVGARCVVKANHFLAPQRRRPLPATAPLPGAPPPLSQAPTRPAAASCSLQASSLSTHLWISRT
ncbi:hypothetical protein ABZP36_005343 [Zizania latifolia]